MSPFAGFGKHFGVNQDTNVFAYGWMAHVELGANCLIERPSRAVKRKIWRRGSLASARKIRSSVSLPLLDIRL